MSSGNGAAGAHLLLPVVQAIDGAAALLAACRVPAMHARTTASAIVLADVWGRGSHGLLRLPYYLERLLAGGYNPAAELISTADTGPLVAFDGDAGLGHWQVAAAAEMSAGRAGEHGVGVAAVSNSGHCGVLGIYTEAGLRAGMIPLVFSNGPAVMPPWGGHAPVLSTSPLAAGIPCRPEPAIVDLATTAVARGKIAQRASEARQLEDGWAFDATGAPTTDPAAALAGMLAPLGGAKGYALALLVEALTGGLVGPSLASDVTDMYRPEQAAEPQRISHLVITLDPRLLDGRAPGAPADRMDELARRVERAGGRLPGAGKPRLEDLAAGAAITVGPTLQGELESWGKQLGAAWPAATAEAT